MPIFSLDNNSPDIDRSCFISSSSDIIGKVKLNKNVNIWYGAVLRGDIESIVIGEGSNIQDNSTVHTDYNVPTVIGKNVTIGHNVVLHSCNIDDNVIVGMGSIILNNAKIAKNCIVGAGSLVTKSIPYKEGSLILGNPAKIIRDLTQDEINSITNNALMYVDKSKKYKEELFKLDEK